MSYLSGLSITELDNNFFTAGTGSVATIVARLGFACAWACSTYWAGRLFADTRFTTTVSTGFWALTWKEATLVARHRLAGTGGISTFTAAIFW